MSKISPIDLGFLTNDIYKNPDDRGGSSGWDASGYEGDKPSGLKIDSYTNPDYPNQIVIGVGGTDTNSFSEFFKDASTDGAFLRTPGELPAQFVDALTYVAKTMQEALAAADGDISKMPDFTATGHSLGGGIVQLIGHVFGIAGMALDSPGAGAIANSPAFKSLVEQLRADFPEVVPQEYPGMNDDYVNINEEGSPMSAIGEHLGEEKHIDVVSDSKSIIGLLVTAALPPPANLAGLVLAVSGAMDNHNAEELAEAMKRLAQLYEERKDWVDEDQNDDSSADAQIAGAIADLIKQHQHSDSDLEEFLSDAVIETLMQNAGEVAYYLRQGASLENAVSNAQHDIVGDMGQVSQDMIGSLITDAYWEKNKQLSESLGIDNSVAGQALDIAVSQAISLAVSQGVDIGLDFVGASIGSSGSWGGYGAGLNNAVAGAIGSYLADELLEGQVNSEAEAIGVQLGKTVGGIIGSYFGPIGTGVGTFIGAMAGDFAGEQWNELDDIWDKGNTIDNIADTTWQLINPEHALEHALNIITSYGKKTPPPTAHARMEWDAEQGEYVVVSSDSADGGNRQAMLDMAQAATAQVQALLEASGGQIIDPSQMWQMREAA